jgi:hypothetical protein
MNLHVAYLAEALCYEPEGRGFNSRYGHQIFYLTQIFRNSVTGRLSL